MNNIKNPVPFYTLKQAAKELNKQLKTDFYDAKKILSLALAYDLNLHIMAVGWKFYCDYNHTLNHNIINFQDEYAESSEEELLADAEKTFKMLNDLSDSFVNMIIDDGGLIRLTNFAIRQIYYKGFIDCENTYNYFDEIMNISNAIKDGGSTFATLDNFYKEKQSSVDRNEDIELWDIVLWAHILSIDLYVNEEEAQDRYLMPIPSKTPNYENNGEAIYRPFITKKNILITHRELHKILNGDLKHLPVDGLDTEITSNQQRRLKNQKIELHPRTQNSASKLLLVLAKMAEIDISQPYAVYEGIKKQAELLGIDKFPNDDTVADWLKKAVEHKEQ